MNIAEFRSLIAEQLEIDRRVKRHRMSGPNLDLLLREASANFHLPVSQLDYEIEERGYRGFMGIIKPRDFKILVYRSEVDRSRDQPRFAAAMVTQSETFAPIPGKMFMQVRSSGIYVKLIPPKNGGDPITDQEVLLHIHHLQGQSPKHRIIRELCQNKFCDYTKVAEIAHQPNADARVNIQISQDRMQAKMLVTKPGDYGAHLQYENLIKILANHGVSHGYDREFLEKFCDEPVYNAAVPIAKGSLPKNGMDLYIEVFNKSEAETANLSQRRSVNEGAVVALLHEASAGEPGYNVLGEEIAAQPGEARPYTIGEGCQLNPETKEITATITGEIIFDDENQSIQISEVHTVEANLQYNIDFPGSVIIKGDVENGYKIKAGGDVTIMGHLGKSQVQCGGYLVAKSGINAVDAFQEVLVRAKENIYTRYINNAGVYSAKSIVVEDGILCSMVFAEEYVICRGKRAVINASEVNARLGIYAKSFGSVSGAKTRLIVAMPLQLKEKRKALKVQYTEQQGKLGVLKQNLVLETRQKDIVCQSQPSEKVINQYDKRIAELQKAVEQTEKIIRTIKARLREIEAETEDLSKQSFITNEKMLHPGVVLTIGSIRMDVHTSYSKGLTFRLKQNEIQPRPYEKFNIGQFVSPVRHNM